MLCPQIDIEGIRNVGEKCKGRAGDIVYPDFSEAFDALP